MDVVNSWFGSFKPYVKEIDKHKSWIMASIVGFTTLGAIYAGSKYRARKHDNIPLLAPNDCSYFGGHLAKIVKIGEADKEGSSFHDYIYEETKKLNYPPLLSMTLPMNQMYVFMNDPKIVKYVLDTKANIVPKSDKFIEEYSELLGNGIFASNGKHWKFHRKVASRMFSMRNLKDFMYDMSVKHTHSTINKLKQLKVSINEGIDINDILGRFSLDTFCEIAFGVDVNQVSDFPSKCEFGVCFDDLVMRVDKRGSDPFWKFKRMLNIGNESFISHDNAVITAFVDDILDAKNNKKTGSFTDESGSGSYDILSLFLKHEPNLTRGELQDIALNFIIAGRDTTRTLLSWFIYELCRDENKDVVQKLYKECDDLTKMNPHPGYNDFYNGLRYLEGALCEALRLHPPVPSIGRSAAKDIKIPNTNHTIRKGDIVLSSCYTTGRCTKIWGKNALIFEPDRWKKKGMNTHDQYKFPVFNVMPRLCLGKTFAMVESKVFIYYLFKDFTFQRTPNKKCSVKTGAVLNMEHGFYINLKQRQSLSG